MAVEAAVRIDASAMTRWNGKSQRSGSGGKIAVVAGVAKAAGAVEVVMAIKAVVAEKLAKA